MRDNVVQIRQIGQDLSCVKCGAITHAACDCGVAYEPAGVRAAKAIAANPGKSDRAIAAEIGVGSNTVRRARQETAPSGAVDRRIGLDGKERRLPERRPLPSDADDPDKAPVLAFQARAGEALRYCFYDGPPDKRAAKAARQTAEAWQKLADEIEEML